MDTIPQEAILGFTKVSHLRLSKKKGEEKLDIVLEDEGFGGRMVS